jgi:hypothetical protein
VFWEITKFVNPFMFYHASLLFAEEEYHPSVLFSFVYFFFSKSIAMIRPMAMGNSRFALHMANTCTTKYVRETLDMNSHILSSITKKNYLELHAYSKLFLKYQEMI